MDGIDAGTVILLRDDPAGPLVLLVERPAGARFAPRMQVFPGGKVDPEDREAGPGPLAVFRRAAARETEEEAGLVVREADLVPFSYWHPPVEAPRRFLTWFFAVRAPEQEVRIDGAEVVSHRWVTPAQALKAHAAEEIELAPPTWLSLHELAPHRTVAAALDAVASRTPPVFQGTVVRQPVGYTFVYPGDVGLQHHPIDLSVEGPRRRLTAIGRPWRWEQTIAHATTVI